MLTDNVQKITRGFAPKFLSYFFSLTHFKFHFAQNAVYFYELHLKLQILTKNFAYFSLYLPTSSTRRTRIEML